VGILVKTFFDFYRSFGQILPASPQTVLLSKNVEKLLRKMLSIVRGATRILLRRGLKNKKL